MQVKLFCEILLAIQTTFLWSMKIYFLSVHK